MSKQIKIAILVDGKEAVGEFKNVGAASKYLADQTSETSGHLESMRAKLRSMSDGLDAAGRKMMGAGKTMTLGMSVPIVAGFGAMVNAARESNRVTAITEQIIKSTGGAANLSAAQISKLSTALSNKTGIDDEVIQKGQNVLLTFTKVRDEAGKGNDVFKRASMAMLDLGTVFGSSDAAALQLGKALNDPVKGITALSRAGVTFTAEQKETIKTLVASNDILGAQKIILAEVEKQVGGTAAASATGFDKMKVAVGNMAESIGNILVPWLEKASAKVSEWTEKFQELSPTVQKFIVIGAGLLAVVGPLVTVLGAVAVALGVILSPVGLVVVGIGLLAVAFVKAYKSSEDFRRIVTGVVDAVKRAVGGFVDAAKMALDGDWAGAWKKAVDTVKNLGSEIKKAFDGVKWGALWDKMFDGAKDMASKISEAVDQWFEDVDWMGVAATIFEKLKTALEWAGEKIVPVAQAIARKMFEKMIPGAGGSDLGDKFGDYMKNYVIDPNQQKALDGGVAWSQSLVRGLSSDMSGAKAAGAKLGAAASGGVGSGAPAGAAWAAGVLNAMVTGLTNGAGRVAAAVGAIGARVAATAPRKTVRDGMGGFTSTDLGSLFGDDPFGALPPPMIVPPDLTSASTAANTAVQNLGYTDLTDYWMRNSGGTTAAAAPVTVNVYGSVTTERDLIAAVRDGLVRTSDQGYATFAPV